MRVVVTIPYFGAPTAEHPDGEPRIILTPLFAFFDLSENETPPSTLHYALPKKLQPIIARSGRWGRIKAEVVCAMTSKYAIALYELVRLRANLEDDLAHDSARHERDRVRLSDKETMILGALTHAAEIPFDPKKGSYVYLSVKPHPIIT